MTHVQRSALLPYSAAQMFNLVNDVDSYPEFIPWCVKCEVHSDSENEKQATMKFAKHGINASVTTCNELDADKKITMHLLKGPFKRLVGTWIFKELDEHSCRVELDLQFSFSNRLYAVTLGPIFNQVANKLVSAFTERAQQLYG
ncbi:MAG: type II toxin-antitoxin system RatA family toxin [Gammaproteobacteria bacterium]|nr:type II toxin-antitoxin system RatA family toxin [Gammaproteobacteria bacterium]MBT8123622.1 type II toxin-antitoxin system RatA family toxin [Gammaproteobacteria bacterium]NNC67846.1 type II toxin-antitoxin system RatA family toxin [Gammaproteobacteria bacterium]